MAKTDILKDPKLIEGTKGSAAMFLCVILFMWIAFTSNVIWMQSFISIAVFLLAVLSVLIGVCYYFMGYDAVKTAQIPTRLPVWWIYGASILSVSWLWFLTSSWVLVLPYMFSRIVLSINYIMVLEHHDKKYTDRKKVDAINPNLERFLKALRNDITKKDDPDNKDNK
jgi:hypothetical protein